jgi:hypothetical protein
VFPWRLMQIYRAIKKKDGRKKELNDGREA